MNKNKIILSFVETIFFNLLIYIFFFQLQDNQEVYLQLNPHPLLLLSVAIGMRYGNYLGIISAAISSLFYSRVFFVLHDNPAELLMYFANYKYILLFFWSAVILGYFKDNHLAQVSNLNNENYLLKQNYKKLKKSYEVVQKTQEELKKQIIGSEESILNLYEIASRLNTLDSEELYTETIGILSKYLKAKAISIYTFNEESGYLRLKIRTGEESNNYKSLNVEDSKGFGHVVYGRQVVKWTDVAEADFPLMAAPLIKDEKVLGIVTITDMDFDRLSEYAFQLFKLIIDWVNKALSQAIYVDSLKETKYIAGTKILQYEAFAERLKAEERRKKEFGMDFSVLEYRNTALDLDSVSEALHRVLRTVDVIGYDSLNRKIILLLPATPKEQLAIVETRITNRFGGTLVRVKEYEQEQREIKVLAEAR